MESGTRDCNNKNDRLLPFLENCSQYISFVDKYYEILNNPVVYNPVKVKKVSTDDEEYLPGVLALYAFHR